MTTSPNDKDLYAPGYPMFVDVRGKRVVVIGGGAVAQRKVETLLEYGAAVHVVSPEVTDRIAELAAKGTITLDSRAYAEGDLAGAALAISACGIPSVDEEICAEAAAQNCLVNVVDVPEKCGFIVPSIVKRGALQIAISTSGAAPTEAKAIRQQLEATYDESWEAYMDLMGQVRLLIKERISGGEPQRRPYYEAASTAGWRQRLASGETISAEDGYAEACQRVKD